MRTGTILLVLLVIAFAHLANPEEITLAMVVTFCFAVMVGALNWKGGAVIIAAIVTVTTGIKDVRQLALNLAPIGIGIVLGAALQRTPGEPHDRVEPVRAIPIRGERGARSDVDPRFQRRDPYWSDENPSTRGPIGRPTSSGGPGTGTDERRTDRVSW